MIRRLAALIVLAAPVVLDAAAIRDVIIDHDGGVDDFVAITLLLRSPAVRVRAITICPADSYLEPATLATRLFLDELGASGITIAQGHSEGINPFPAAWRKDASRVLGIRALTSARPSETANPTVTADAAHHLAKLLSGDGVYTILETGPLTNIADALRLDPAVRKHISRIYVMGGAVRVGGNVEQKGHDGSAEWNIFNQPKAAAEVLESGIPITLVPLDATNKTPLTHDFLNRLSRESSVAAQLAAQALRLVVNQQGNDRYYFWDTLTAAALVDPGLVSTKRLRIRVVTDGASQGRTIEDVRGTPVDVALDANRERVEAMFLKLLGR